MIGNKENVSNVQRTGILITLLAAAFITSMSTTVTGNMIPNFTEFFGVSSNLAQWLTSGATLISGITISITAFLIKRVSNKVYFFSAMAAFTAGSLAAVLSVIATLSAGRLYDKVGIRPMFIVGIVLFAVFSVMGFLFSQNTPITYIAITFALQSIAMSTLNSPATAMALSGLEGRERVDGSAIFNTLRQISSSLASTLSVLIYTLIGSNMAAIHGVYIYFGFVTVFIAAAVILYLKAESKKSYRRI